MATENLQIPDIAASQSSKEVTANAAHNLLDRAMNKHVSKVISGSTEFSTTETRENTLIILTGTPGAPFTIDMPDTNIRRLFVLNLTDADCTIENSVSAVGSGDTILIPTLEGLEFHYDGLDFRLLAGGGGGSVAVDDESTEIIAEATRLKFFGEGVVVTDGGSGVAEIAIAQDVIGAAGPYRFLSSYPLTGASVDILDIGDADIKELMLVIVGLEVATDDTETLLRYDFGAGVQATGYTSSNQATAGGSTFNSSATNGIILGSSAGNSGQGNAAGENGAWRVFISDPFGTNQKKTNFIGAYARALDGATTSIQGGGSHSTATALSALQLINNAGNFDAGTVYVFGLRAENPVIAPGGVPGPVLQHVHSRDDVTRSTTSDTFVTATSAVTITPRSAAHRVRIRVSTTVAHGSINGAGYLTLFRNGVTDLTPAGRDAMGIYVNGQNAPLQTYFEFVDSPATTSPVTYNLFFRENSQGTVTIGARGSDTNFDCYTMMVAEEILGDGEIAVAPYIVTSPYLAGAPSASQVVLSHRFTRDVDFPVDFAGSQFTADVAATASTAFDVQKNGVSVGTLTFAIAGTSATFSVSPAVSFAPGDLLRVIAPATPDATLVGMDITLAGTTGAID